MLTQQRSWVTRSLVAPSTPSARLLACATDVRLNRFSRVHIGFGVLVSGFYRKACHTDHLPYSAFRFHDKRNTLGTLESLSLLNMLCEQSHLAHASPIDQQKALRTFQHLPGP